LGTIKKQLHVEGYYASLDQIFCGRWPQWWAPGELNSAELRSLAFILHVSVDREPFQMRGGSPAVLIVPWSSALVFVKSGPSLVAGLYPNFPNAYANSRSVRKLCRSNLGIFSNPSQLAAAVAVRRVELSQNTESWHWFYCPETLFSDFRRFFYAEPIAWADQGEVHFFGSGLPRKSSLFEMTSKLKDYSQLWILPGFVSLLVVDTAS
jgi:hypothetical protein